MADDPMGVSADQELHQRCLQVRSSVDGFLSKQQPKEALAEALRSPPYEANNIEIKNHAAESVLKAIGAMKESDIRGAVASLGEDERFTLMKYLYRFWGMGLPGRTNAQLFTWHAALVDHSGEATIANAMFDWRGV
mmetsp:Transcript_56643/g.106754  ORF Transcript_56643/g.106754 Transcript_56643/m.106754 type:complete len:136 (-) Transcript_56643:69-476(-)